MKGFEGVEFTHTIHGTVSGIFTYMKFISSKSTIHVGKYAIPMDGMDKLFPPKNDSSIENDPF